MCCTPRFIPYLKAIPSLGGYVLHGRFELGQAQEVEICILLLVVLLSVQVEGLKRIVGRGGTDDDGVFSTSECFGLVVGLARRGK
jgi:hypothetical protein